MRRVDIRLTPKEAKAIMTAAGNSMEPSLSWEECVRDIHCDNIQAAMAAKRAYEKIHAALWSKPQEAESDAD